MNPAISFTYPATFLFLTTLSVRAQAPAPVDPAPIVDLIQSPAPNGTIQAMGGAIGQDGTYCYGTHIDPALPTQSRLFLRVAGMTIDVGTGPAFDFRVEGTNVANGYSVVCTPNPGSTGLPFFKVGNGSAMSSAGIESVAGLSEVLPLVCGNATNSIFSSLYQVSIGNPTFTPLTILPLPGNASGGLTAEGISPSGRFTVGRFQSMPWGQDEGFLYDLYMNAVVGLGTTSHGLRPFSAALDVSDGGVAVGYGAASPGPFPRPNALVFGTPNRLLGTLPNDATSRANAISADGRFVVGYSESFTGTRRGFIYDRQTPSLGMMDLNNYLGGSLPAGWTITEAVDVSANGSAIFGYASDSSGQIRAFHSHP